PSLGLRGVSRRARPRGDGGVLPTIRAVSSAAVPLDRRSIEKRDFPARLRGYDRGAVDAHLRWVADELEARVGSTADAAAEQVRAVLAAAERSAAEIVARAETDAQRIGSVAGRAGEETTARERRRRRGALADRGAARRAGGAAGGARRGAAARRRRRRAPRRARTGAQR